VVDITGRQQYFFAPNLAYDLSKYSDFQKIIFTFACEYVQKERHFHFFHEYGVYCYKYQIISTDYISVILFTSESAK